MENLMTVLKMSITGSIIFFIYSLIKPLTKKNFSSSWHYNILIIILIFFIVPVNSFIKLSKKPIPNISPIVEIQEFRHSDDIIGNENIKDTQDTQKVQDIGRNQYEDKTKYEGLTTTETENYSPNKRNFNIDFHKDTILYIWICGMIILFLLKIIPYIRFKSAILTNSAEVKDKDILELFNLCKEKLSINSKISLKNCKFIGSPMLIGVFNPTVLIPNICEDEKTLKMIFLHELNHYKRKDIIIKHFCFIVNIIHWLNPITYILLKKIDLYCEYSIDERVVDKMKIEDRKYYGQTILKLIDNYIVRKNAFTTAMGSSGKELKSRLENMLFSRKSSRTRYVVSLLVLILILVSGLTIACSIIPDRAIKENDSFVVYIKEDGLYFSYLNNGEVTKIHEGKEFSYPLISKSGDYIAYTKEESLYIYDIKNKKYEKIADEIHHYYTSYDWIDDKKIVYATNEPGFVVFNALTKDKIEHLDEYYYANFKASNKNIIYGRKMSKWTTDEGEFVSNDGIVEINLNNYDSKNKMFSTNIIIEGRKSTDEVIGYDPTIWDMTEDGRYIYIMEKPASGSLSTDGISIGVYDVEGKTHTNFTYITSLPYKDHLSINPKNNNLIALIEGGYREMILNKEVLLLDTNKDKGYETINFMDKDLVAMTPSFTLDGGRLLYSATRNSEDIWKTDFSKAYENWESQPHHIYEYDLKTSKVKKITDGEHFDFMPISISKDEILFSRYKGNGYHSLIKLVNGKEEILAENIIIDYEYEGGIFGFYGHLETEKGIDIFLNKKENPYIEPELTDLAESSKVDSNQSTNDILNELASRDFSIQGESLSNADDEMIVEFGKAFINLFNGAVAEQEKVSFKKYISNKNLRKFTDKMLELTQKQELQGGNTINYGLENEFKQVKLQHIEDNLCYLELPFQFEGSGMECKMLVTSENKSLKLVDLYFGSKDGVDTSTTGHHAVRKVKDPNLWKNEEWIKGVFRKLKEFEESLGSQVDSVQSSKRTDWEPTTYEIVNDLPGVIMTVKKGMVSNIGLTLVFENNSDNQCTYGEYFLLEKKINEIWYRVPVAIDGSYGFEDIGYDLDSGGNREWEINWDWLYGSLDPGEYRIVKHILAFRNIGKYDKCYLAAEFKV